MINISEFQWIAQFGFAAIVTAFVLWRLEPALREQTKAITLLTIVVARISGQDMNALNREFGIGGGD